MNDERGLNGLAAECHEMARSKGFWDGATRQNIGEKLMMVVGEVSEAHDEYRSGHAIGLIEYEHMGAEPHTYRRTRNLLEPLGRPGVNVDPENSLIMQPGKPVGFPIELADVIIRTLDLASGLGIDIEEAIRIKMDFNATRPRLHGRLV